MPESPDIGQNSDRGISNFQISGQSFIKENCHNFRTSDNIDIKLGPVTKLYKRNQATAEEIDDEAMSANCDVNFFFQIYDQFWAIQEPDSAKLTFLLIVSFYLTKSKKKK